jgi:tetratricopeptide (TPR) repeat protein
MRISIILILLLFSLFTYGNKLNVDVDSAAHYYSQGMYELAAKKYESVLNTGVESAELYFNLGNSYYKSKNITLAILSYERAKRLAPDDEDIKFNLELANKFTTDKIEKLPELFYVNWFNNVLNLFGTNTWALISLFSFITCLILFIIFLFSRIIVLKKISFWLSILLLLLSIKSFALSYISEGNITNKNEALVLTPTISVKSSPDAKGTDLFMLHEGTKVSVTETIGNWSEIILSDGNVGWVLSSDLIKI